MGTIDDWAEKISFGGDCSNPLTKYLYINNELVTEAHITKAIKISDNAFISYEGLTKVIIGDSVETIGEYAFYECSNLSDITIESVVGKKVMSIGAYAFAECSSLTSVVIGNGIKPIIEAGAFENCSSLTSVTRPDGKDRIGTLCALGDHKGIFKGCSSLAPINSQSSTTNVSSGCYVATCVYGSYDCPEVWTLRRYRDNTLASTWYGRTFIRTYYAISPTLVKWFGKTKWFKKMWKGTLDRMVKKLQDNGVASTPYADKNWK